MQVTFNLNDVADYERFLAIKRLPIYRIKGRSAWFPDEYAARVGLLAKQAKANEYQGTPGLFDYQRDIAAMAIAKRKFGVFADPGRGKTFIIGEYIMHAADAIGKKQKTLIVCPPMVVPQTVSEYQRFYGDRLPIEKVSAADLQAWLLNPKGSRYGITNFEALKEDLQPGLLGALAVDESSIMKSHYGAYGKRLIELGRGLEWKLCATGTPAPNDRIEYANHAVFLDQCTNVNAFLGTFFVNRGQTDNRWEMKPHAVKPFYRHLSHWCIFLSNPATYGWKDNCGTLPPIITHIHHVDLSPEQQRQASIACGGTMFVTKAGGITSRAKLARIAKGQGIDGDDIPTAKYEFIRGLVDQWPDESTIIWARYNNEQDRLDDAFPDAASLRGETPFDRRLELIDDFKAGRRKQLISKAKILGYGLNLQVATRQVFSTCQDSYEEFFQCVKRSNRIGSTKPLNVHIPVTELEIPMLETVLRKAKQVESDTLEQEAIFKDAAAY